MRKAAIWICCLILAMGSVARGFAQEAPPPPPPPADESPEDPSPSPDDDASTDDDGGDDGGGGGGGAGLAVGGAVLVVGAIVGGMYAAGAFSDDPGLVGLANGTGWGVDTPITIRFFGDAGDRANEMEMRVLARFRLLEW